MILDINAHLGHFPFRPLRHNDPAGLLGLMDRSGIDRAVVSSIHSVFYRDAHAGNEELAEAAAGAGGRFIPLATVNPTFAGWERDLDQAVSEWNMPGARLVPEYHSYQLTDPEGQAVLAACAERGLPVALPQRLEDRRQRHAFDRAEDLALGQVLEAVKPFPDLKIILQNWLGISANEIVEAGLRERVLIDFTRMAVVMQKVVPQLAEALGYRAIAFGTHIPFNYPGPALVKLDILDASPEEVEGVSWRNAARFLGL